MDSCISIYLSNSLGLPWLKCVPDVEVYVLISWILYNCYLGIVTPYIVCEERFLSPEMFQTVGFLHFRLSFKTVKFFLIFICQDGEANWNFLDCGSFLFLHGDRIISCFLVLLCLLTGWCNVFYCNGEVLFEKMRSGEGGSYLPVLWRMCCLWYNFLFVMASWLFVSSINVCTVIVE